MLLGIFNCSPNSDSAYMSKVFDSWEKATDENKTISALGDFNKNWLNDEDSACVRYMLTFAVLLVNMHNLTKTNEYSVMLMSITYFMQIIRVLLKLVQTRRHVGSHV